MRLTNFMATKIYVINNINKQNVRKFQNFLTFCLFYARFDWIFLQFIVVEYSGGMEIVF